MVHHPAASQLTAFFFTIPKHRSSILLPFCCTHCTTVLTVPYNGMVNVNFFWPLLYSVKQHSFSQGCAHGGQRWSHSELPDQYSLPPDHYSLPAAIHNLEAYMCQNSGLPSVWCLRTGITLCIIWKSIRMDTHTAFLGTTLLSLYGSSRP